MNVHKKMWEVAQRNKKKMILKCKRGIMLKSLPSNYIISQKWFDIFLSSLDKYIAEIVALHTVFTWFNDALELTPQRLFKYILPRNTKNDIK